MDGVNIKMNCSIFNYMPHLYSREHYYITVIYSRVFCLVCFSTIETVGTAPIISWKIQGKGDS